MISSIPQGLCAGVIIFKNQRVLPGLHSIFFIFLFFSLHFFDWGAFLGSWLSTFFNLLAFVCIPSLWRDNKLRRIREEVHLVIWKALREIYWSRCFLSFFQLQRLSLWMIMCLCLFISGDPAAWALTGGLVSGSQQVSLNKAHSHSESSNWTWTYDTFSFSTQRDVPSGYDFWLSLEMLLDGNVFRG